MFVAFRRRLAVGAAVLAAVPCALAATTPDPVLAATPGFNSLAAPQRVLDTRATGTTADGQYVAGGAVAAGTTYVLPLAGRVGLPAEMAAAVLNVTVAEPAAAGFVTVYPCGTTLPTASNLNYLGNQTVPNAVIAALGDGAVCLFTKSATHLIVDVSGWFAPGSYAPLGAPARLYDSRAERPTVDGQQAGEGVRPAESETRVRVAGRGGLDVAPSSVVLNVTATETQGPGFATVYPCGVARPNASNLNYQPNQTVPNLVVAKVGAGGEVCVFTKAAAHLVVDVAGALGTAAYTPLASPQRLLDTRTTGTTADNTFRGAGTQPLRASLQLDVTRSGVPDGAAAVMLNVTAVNAQAAGYLATHPRGSARPTASNVNYAPGATIANAVVARVGTGGEICVFNLAPTDVIVDVAGYLTGPAPATVGDPCPGTNPGDPSAAAAVVGRPALHQVVGVDRVAIVVCDLGQGFPALDPAQVAAWANQTVSPWFAEASGGAFSVQFAALTRIAAAGPGACMNDAIDLTGAPFTNVIAVPEIDDLGGLAGPGGLNADTNVLDGTPPEQSGRGGYVGGRAAFLDPSVFIHEIGHTIHWPHSYIRNPGESYDEYDNPVDVMSGKPDADFDSANYCEVPGTGGQKVACFPQHTLAFNRMAAGWVGGTQIAVHRSGHANYVLDRPTAPGMQTVVLPDPGDPNRMMTLEARPATPGGRDQFLEVPGVAVHLVDQTGAGGDQRVSLWRRQQQAAGQPFSYEHVVTPGQTLSVHGVTISVYQSGGGEGYALVVSGTYRSPGVLAESQPVLVTQSGDGPWLTRLP